MLELELFVRISGTCVTKAKLKVGPAIVGGCAYILLHGLPQIAAHFQ